MIIMIGVVDCEPDLDCNRPEDHENLSGVVIPLRSGAADG